MFNEGWFRMEINLLYGEWEMEDNTVDLGAEHKYVRRLI